MYFILRVVAVLLSVASSFHAYRSRVGRVHAGGEHDYEEVTEEYEEEILV